MAALRYNVRKIYGWVTDKEREHAEARRLAENAVRFGEDDAVALSRAAISFSYFFFEHERAEALVDRSLAINPNLASAWQIRGQISLYLGQHEKALKEIEQAVRLNPIDPENYLAETVRHSLCCCWASMTTHVIGRTTLSRATRHTRCRFE